MKCHTLPEDACWERKMRENSGVETDGPTYGLKGRERCHSKA